MRLLFTSAVLRLVDVRPFMFQTAIGTRHISGLRQIDCVTVMTWALETTQTAQVHQVSIFHQVISPLRLSWTPILRCRHFSQKGGMMRSCTAASAARGIKRTRHPPRPRISRPATPRLINLFASHHTCSFAPPVVPRLDALYPPNMPTYIVRAGFPPPFTATIYRHHLRPAPSPTNIILTSRPGNLQEGRDPLASPGVRTPTDLIRYPSSGPPNVVIYHPAASASPGANKWTPSVAPRTTQSRREARSSTSTT
jgi:hypothetical protein